MLRRKRVLKISDAWHWFAEVEQLLLNTRALLLRGWQVDVACQPESPLWERATAVGATLHPLPGMRSNNPLTRPANLLRIARLIDGLRPYAIHAYRSPPHALAGAARTLARHKPPLIRSRGAAQRLRRHPLNRWLYQSADAVIASSSAIADDLFRIGVKSEQIHVVRGGVDSARVVDGDGVGFCQRHQLPRDRPLIGVLGRIDDVKGQRHAVDAVVELNRRGAHCALVCSGEPWGDAGDRLRAHVERVGAGKDVWLLDRTDDVAGFLAAIDVAVVASIGSEVMARALLEEMAAGCAVVATQVGVIPELLDRSTGVLVPPADPAALAVAIEGLLHDPRRRAVLGAAARAQVQREYTIERLGEQLERIYRQARRSWRRQRSGDR